jgi:hypothetical protein
MKKMHLGKATKVLLLGQQALSTAESPSAEPPHNKQEKEKQEKGILNRFTHAANGLIKEAKIGPELHEQAMGALHLMQEMDSNLKQVLDNAYGYVVFPSVAKAALVLGVTFGRGEVFEKGQVIGYAGIVQITGGVQLGGQTVHILVILEDQKALEQLKSGKTSFAANASLGIVKTGITAAKGPYGLRVFVYPEGGEILEAAIGGQTIKFRPAVLGQLRSAG